MRTSHAALLALALAWGCGDARRGGAPEATATSSAPVASASARGAEASPPEGIDAGRTPEATSAPRPAPSASAARDPFAGPCAEPRLLLAVRRPAEAVSAVDRAVEATRHTPAAKLTSSAPRARGEVRIETAEIEAPRFRGVDDNHVAVMAVCADRDTCSALLDAYRHDDTECRCEAMCEPPKGLTSRPVAVDEGELEKRRAP